MGGREKGVEGGPEARHFANNANRQFSKDAAKQAAAAGVALIRASGFLDESETQLQMINFDNRPPGIYFGAEGDFDYPLISEKAREVVEYGSKLAYYGPRPTAQWMCGYPRDRSEYWGRL